MVDQNDLHVETQLRMLRPASAVFEAIVRPEQMSKYFISSGNGHLVPGASVTWRFDDFGVEVFVNVKAVEDNRRIAFEWTAAGRLPTTVEIELEPDDDATMVKVKESGWAFDPDGVAHLVEQTQGWVHMLCCMKAYLEHGINLREGLVG